MKKDLEKYLSDNYKPDEGETCRHHGHDDSFDDSLDDGLHDSLHDHCDYLAPGLPDSCFQRGSAPMTSREIRCVSLAMLSLRPGQKFLDIGAGTGSVSVEAARLLAGSNGEVVALEKEKEAAALIRVNADKFNLSNLTIIHGEAPAALKEAGTVHRVFLGGSGGNIHEILDECRNILLPEGVIVANFILLESFHAALQSLKKLCYEDIEITSLAVARSKPLGKGTMMQPLNPVYIVRATAAGR